MMQDTTNINIPPNKNKYSLLIFKPITIPAIPKIVNIVIKI